MLSDRTRGLIGAADLAKMKKSAILVNTSRGPIVDEEALIAALKNRTIVHAGLDVYDKEPLPPDHPLTSSTTSADPPHGLRSQGKLRTSTPDDRESSWLDGKPINVINPEALKKAA